jgi:pyruvate-ferredoxin/flavodoxin oxidoreductase
VGWRTSREQRAPGHHAHIPKVQTCFFAIAGVLPRDEAIAKIKDAIAKTYGRRGPDVIRRNHLAVDSALEGLHRIEVPGLVTSARELPPAVAGAPPEFVRTVTAAMLAGRGDELPVSALPADGTYPSGTAAYEKRNISELVAFWDPELCIQCGNCSFVCPHSVIRSTYYDDSLLAEAPPGFQSAPLDARGLPDTRYTLQIYAEDCTGCELCVQACPVSAPGSQDRKAINLTEREPIVAAARENIAFFETLPVAERSRVDFGTVRGTQFLQPLFEFSGACAGCGENALRQAALPALRRPSPGSQRDRVLVHLRRKPAHHAVDLQRRRSRPGLVELTVRGQRRVRSRLPAGCGRARGTCQDSPRRAERAGRS